MVEPESAPVEPNPEPTLAVDEVESRTPRLSFGALLMRAGIASDEQVKEALADGMRTGERLGEVVVRRGWATEERIAQLLAEQWELRFLKADAISIDSMAMRRVSATVAHQLEAVPISFDEYGLVMAIAEPSEDMFAAVQARVGDVSYVVVARSALDSLLRSRFFAEDDSEQNTPFKDVENEPSGATTDHSNGSPGADADRTEVVEVEVSEVNAVENEVSNAVEMEVSEVNAVEMEVSEVNAVEVNAVQAQAAEVTPSEAAVVGIHAKAPQGSGAGIEVVLNSIEVASTELHSIRREVSSLGESLSEAHEQLSERDAQLEGLEAARKRDGETIARLESELAQRVDLFDTLKGKVADLTATFDEK